MAVVSGTVSSVEIIKGNDRDPLLFANVFFTVSGTYAQADNGILTGVAGLIGASRRNGKTLTLRSVGMWQPARRASDPSLLLGMKTVAISTNDVTFEITNGSTANTIEFSTEFTDGAAVPSQATPFGLLVGFTEA